MKKELLEEEVVVRVFCPSCGRDLGPVQPLPSTKVKCPICKKWIPAQGKDE